jgi:hypothetical protein
MEMHMVLGLNAKKLLGSLGVVIFAFSAVAVSSAWVDQAHAIGGKPKPIK